jgi:mannitol/fructose-specific phosphotransferase system IIA component (Ntr-type)
MKSLLTALQGGRLVELPEPDKERALEYLAHLIEAVPDFSGGLDVTAAMRERERTQNTGIGLGVACPHIRVAAGDEMVCSLGWSPQGIEYGALDGSPVHLVVMYLIPESQKNAYLKEVSALARALHSTGGLQPLAGARSIADVREKLLDWVLGALETSAPAAKAKMIRLQAREAATAEPRPPEARGSLQLAEVLVLFLEQGRRVVLSANTELAAQIESDPRLLGLASRQEQFDAAGYRLVFHSSCAYGAERSLKNYFAVKSA